VRVWTKSACVVLAWGILLIIVAAAGLARPARPAPADIRMTASTELTRAGVQRPAAAPVTAAGPAARYVVQPGDTLSGIAARFAVRGGWPALYAANRPLLGPDPDLIYPGTVLLLPGQMIPVRYTVVAGDTLSGIAAALAVPGGWPALYAANRAVIGPDPGLIHPGTVLTVPSPAARAPAPAASGPGRRRPPAPPAAPSGPAASRHRPVPARTAAPAAAGMPSWLKTLLLAVGLLAGAAFLAEPVLALRRRRSAAPPAAPPAETPPTAAPRPGPGTTTAGPGPGQGPGAGRLATTTARIVLADHDRLVVTCSQRDGAVCVLRPPGCDPREILRAARVVLPEGPYRQLAGRLGLPPSWPVVLADYDRLVVTCSKRDGTVCVLRPPGEDPMAILRAARLVVPEGAYAELADQLGVPASWPMPHSYAGPP
jgi:LysM repeat protein